MSASYAVRGGKLFRFFGRIRLFCVLYFNSVNVNNVFSNAGGQLNDRKIKRILFITK